MSELYDESHDSAPADHGELPPSSDVAAGGAGSEERADAGPDEKALVQKLLKTIHGDKKHYKNVFQRMRKDMFMAMHGRDPDWPAKNYKANIVGRHINMKVAAIYAKNPKVVARRKEMMDFALWDENVQTLMQAMALLQQEMAKQNAAMEAARANPEAAMALGAAAMGHNGGPPMPDPAVAQAQALIQDVQTGMQRREMLKKFGRTLELLYANAMRQQTPLDFKSGMKSVVRRAATTGVGYVELGFQREYGVPPDVNNELDDARFRLKHLEEMLEDASEGEIDENSAEMAKLKAMIADLEARPQVLIRTGLTFKWHQATRVIPDRHCTQLGGFMGGKRLTTEEVMPKCDAEALFKVELGENYTPYNVKGEREGELKGVDMGEDYDKGIWAVDRNEDDMVCIFKHYDKRAGLVYYLCDGHDKLLQPAEAPDVTVPRFWPVYPLTFNQVESETELFGPSDVALLRDQQNELNRSRQGKREHRNAARPRFVFNNGTFDPDKDLPALETAGAFEMIGLTGDPSVDIAKRLQPFPMPGVDPNLYDANEVMQDGMLTVGAQAAQLGGTSKSTATEAAIADGAMSTSDASAVDDLDAFLTAIFRDGGIILMANMTKDQVVKIVGPGAVWVEDLGMSPEDIANEVFLEVEAGSSGKPNQPQEIRNFKDLAPLLLQVPGIPPEKLAKEAVRRLDDRLDLNEWYVEGLPAMVAQNRAQPMQPGADPAASDPNQQGGEGGDKTQTPSDPAGSGPAFGSNQM